VEKRIFSKNNIANFKDQFETESWGLSPLWCK
jgi:hypothetical protein